MRHPHRREGALRGRKPLPHQEKTIRKRRVNEADDTPVAIAKARRYEKSVITLLDGAVGTQLLVRGVATPIPLWSAAAITTAPGVLAEIHRDYAHAGATVHTANTFRTKRRQVGDDWQSLAENAVRISRTAIPASHKLVGSIAPLEDCYSPRLTPENPRHEHRELARCLANSGVDILLCETFPTISEGLIALEESVATGVESWISFTAGPDADLLTPSEIREGAREAVKRGAAAVFINCVPAATTLPYVEALSGLDVPFGAYANAGRVEEKMGWAPAEQAVEEYLAHVATWVAAGATLIGGCCGTGPEHIRAMHKRFIEP